MAVLRKLAEKKGGHTLEGANSAKSATGEGDGHCTSCTSCTKNTMPPIFSSEAPAEQTEVDPWDMEADRAEDNS